MSNTIIHMMMYDCLFCESREYGVKGKERRERILFSTININTIVFLFFLS